MELSVNTLVVLILGVVILGGGHAITNSLSDTSDKLLETVDASTEAQISSLLARGELVAVPDSVRTGFFGRYAFYVGFKNKLTANTNFYMDITPESFITESGTKYDYADGNCRSRCMPQPFMQSSSTIMALEPNEEKVVPVSLDIDPNDGPFNRGTYIYQVVVTYDNSGSRTEYGPNKLIRVTIK